METTHEVQFRIMTSRATGTGRDRPVWEVHEVLESGTTLEEAWRRAAWAREVHETTFEEGSVPMMFRLEARTVVTVSDPWLQAQFVEVTPDGHC